MNNNTLTIPAIPKDWIAHSGVIPAGNGYRTKVRAVLHKASAGSYHQYVIHTAYEYNGEWAYEQGDYFMDLESAMKRFINRK